MLERPRPPRPDPMRPFGPLRSGELVSERYRLEERLDVGAFGEVWRAADTRVGGNKTVALKFLRSEHAQDAEALRRLRRELQALAAVDHPNVVEVTDTGEWDGRPYLVLKYVRGESLSSWLSRRRAAGRAPKLGTAFEVFAQLCEGVAAAHRLPEPIVHRDLKPANIMLERDFKDEHRVKVLDFGVSRLGEGTQTLTGDVIGSPPYMAPEQGITSSAPIGPWSDVFSLGVLLVEVLTLRRGPDEDDQVYWSQVAKERESEIPVLLKTLLAAAPELQSMAYKMLRYNGADRYQDAAELLDELRTLALPITGRITGLDEDGPPIVSTKPAPKPLPPMTAKPAVAQRWEEDEDAKTVMQELPQHILEEAGAGRTSFADEEEVDAPTRLWDGSSSEQYSAMIREAAKEAEAKSSSSSDAPVSKAHRAQPPSSSPATARAPKGISGVAWVIIALLILFVFTAIGLAVSRGLLL